MLTGKDLARAADHFAAREGFVGHLLCKACWREGVGQDDLARRLGIDLTALHHLYLCLAPREDHYDADLRQIAGHVGADVESLRGLLANKE